MTTDIGLRRAMGLPYGKAVERTIAALKAEGFGVLTQIDIQATLKEKLNANFRRYVILGACNPTLAYRALSANLDVGLLLPCNVTVYEDGDGSVVTAVDPMEMLGSLSADPVTRAVAVEAAAKLRRVLELIPNGVRGGRGSSHCLAARTLIGLGFGPRRSADPAIGCGRGIGILHVLRDHAPGIEE